LAGVFFSNTHTIMISFYLAAACCLPASNPEARVREKELFRAVAKERARLKREGAGQSLRGARWNVIEAPALAASTGKAA
jgi:hypothetical protein